MDKLENPASNGSGASCTMFALHNVEKHSHKQYYTCGDCAAELRAL
jgi:hypothetical protein